VRGLRHRAAHERLGAPGIAGSAALHVLAALTFVIAGGAHARPRLPPVYRVTLVAALGAPPAAGPAATPAPTPAPAPQPKPPAVRAQPRARAVPIKPPSRSAPAVATAPASKRAPPPPTPTAKPVSRAPTPSAATAAPSTVPAGNPNGSPGGSDATTIKTEGVEFPFPVYLHNLVAQVYRRWRPPPSNALLEAEVFFLVHRDGSVTGLQFTRRSGSFAFDLEAQGAIEAAARSGAFGTLPAGYGPDLLPVSFYFNPRSAR